MGTVPTPRTWANPEVVDDTMMNTIRDALNFLLDPPRCVLTDAGGGALTNGAYTAVTFGTEVKDNDSMHSTVTNPTRITIQTAGTYRFSGIAGHASSATANAVLAIRKNGTTLYQGSRVYGAIGFDGACTWVFPGCVVGDYFELMVFTNQAGDTVDTLNSGPRFEARWDGLS